MNVEEQNSLEKMMEVTACDEETARLYLTSCHFNVEVAIRNFFDGVWPQQDEYEDVIDNFDQFDDDDVDELPQIPEPEQIAEVQEVVPVYHSVFKFLADLFTLPVRLPIYLLSIVFGFLFGKKTEKKFTTMHAFITDRFPELSRHKNNFYGKTLTDLRTDCQANGWKYVVAYIHSDTKETAFLMNCLQSNLSRMITQNNGVLFGTLAGSDDANRLIVDRFRMGNSCVIVYQVATNTLNRRLMIDDLRNPEAVNRNIQLVLLDLIAEDAEREAIRNQHNESRRLMEMQNQEYEESLQRDRQRIAKEREEKEAAERARKEEEEKQRLSAERIQKIRDYKQELASTSNQSSADSGQSSLQIRFPSGRKIIRFDPQEPLTKIFEEAMQDEKCPLLVQMHSNLPRKAIACLPQWYFEILEKEELEPKQECLDTGLTFEDAGISHGYLIFVDNL